MHRVITTTLWLSTGLALALASTAARAVELNPGDILVVGSHVSEKRVIAINPSTGGQTPVTPVNTFGNPVDIAAGPGGSIFVADNTNDQIYQVDPLSGTATPLLLFSFDVHALAVTPEGRMFAASRSPSQVVEVDIAAGMTTPISEAGFLFLPTAIAVEDDGSILVLDNFNSVSQSVIIRINVATGGQTILADDEALRASTGMALEATGQIVVSADGVHALLRVDPVTGMVSNLTSNDAFASPESVAVDRDGSLIVTDDSTGEVLRVDAATGNVAPVAQGGLLTLPVDAAVFGLEVSILSCAGFEAPLDSGPVAANAAGVLMMRTVITDANGAPVTGGLAAPPVLATRFSHRQPAVPPADVTATPVFLPPTELDSVPALRGNQFFFSAEANHWVQGMPTEQFAAPGTYTAAMISGDRNAYVFAPECTATYVVQ